MLCKMNQEILKALKNNHNSRKAIWGWGFAECVL